MRGGEWCLSRLPRWYKCIVMQNMNDLRCLFKECPSDIIVRRPEVSTDDPGHILRQYTFLILTLVCGHNLPSRALLLGLRTTQGLTREDEIME